MKKFFSFKRNHKGFTIVELVIVIAVIAILAAVLIPTFSGIIEKAKYSNALQTANSQLKADSLNYTAVNGGKVPDDTVYQVDGYYFKVVDNALVAITKTEYDALNTDIRNIIFLIPDGAGFGTYDIANALKKYNNGTAGVKNQATPITNNAIQGMTVNGLYLDEFMIATADTYQYYGEADGATDSTAAGTALLGGYKTNYLMCGVDNQANARANLLEVCRLAGKSTGVVTTKCLIDATPCAGNVHLLRRPDQNASYQEDANKQYMANGVDVLLAYGTDGGYYRDGTLIETPLKARDYGYSIVTDKASLNSVVSAGATKVFSSILSDCNGEYGSKSGTDYQANHIKYDVNANGTTDLTLMDMAKGALTVLSENIDNENGFCLMIEGGAIDNACEGRNVKEGVGDYLAFDEVFAYCVNWAMNDGHTIVVACPDHDSGGFYADPNGSAPQSANAKGTAYDTMDQVITALSNGTMQDGTVLAGQVSGHSGQNVPVWLYAPEKVRSKILTNLGVPQDTSASKVRTGNYCDGTTINTNYEINNSDLSPAILSALGLSSFDEATEELFYQVNKDTTTFGTYNATTETFTFKNGETVKRNSTYWTDKNGQKHDFDCGYSLYLTNDGDTYGGTSGSTNPKLHVNPAAEPGTYPNRFYVPKSALIAMRYLSN